MLVLSRSKYTRDRVSAVRTVRGRKLNPVNTNKD